MFLNLENASPGRLVKPGCWNPRTEFFSVDPGRALRICFSNKFPGDADAAGPGITLCSLNDVLGKTVTPKDVYPDPWSHHYIMLARKRELGFWIELIYN